MTAVVSGMIADVNDMTTYFEEKDDDSQTVSQTDDNLIINVNESEKVGNRYYPKCGGVAKRTFNFIIFYKLFINNIV